MKLDIKKGDNMHFPIWAVHYGPDNYPDPNLFKPERFVPENRHKLVP